MNFVLPQFSKLGFIILLLGGGLFWLDSAYFEPRRMPECQQDKLPEGRICLSHALGEWGGRVVWIDARSNADFEINHLRLSDNRMFQIQPGARKQEQIDAAIERMIMASELNECIVIFCTGDCKNADDIAQALKSQGLIDAPIYTLEGGWDAIRKEGSLLGQ